MTSKHYYDLIFVITGPENAIYYKPTLKFFSNKTDHPVIIGDGIEPLIYENATGILIDTFRFLNKNSFFNASNILFYIHAHAIKDHSQYYLNLGLPVELSIFFSIIKDMIAKPIDIIFLPCYGKLALSYIRYLPENSSIAFFSDEESTTSPANLQDIFDVMSTQDVFTLDNFYYQYLAHLPNKQNPTLVKLPDIFIDPLELTSIFLSKPVHSNIKKYIHNHFTKTICMSFNCYNKVSNVIDKLEKSTSIDIFLEDNHKYQNLLKSLQNWQIDIISNLSNHSCAKTLINLKTQIDTYLDSHNFPLELDLDYYNWEKPIQIDEDIEKMSNRELFNVFIRSFFNQNDKFPTPEYLEIGLLFGVIADISTYFFN